MRVVNKFIVKLYQIRGILMLGGRGRTADRRDLQIGSGGRENGGLGRPEPAGLTDGRGGRVDGEGHEGAGTARKPLRRARAGNAYHPAQGVLARIAPEAQGCQTPGPPGKAQCLAVLVRVRDVSGTWQALKIHVSV